MLNTDYYTFSGKSKWAHLFTPDNQFGDPNWHVTLYPTKESQQEIEELKKRGIRNQLKKDEDGYYMKFKRPVSKTSKNITRHFDPPAVFNADGTPFEGNGIGNGSDIEVKVEGYGFKSPTGTFGYAIRLLEVKIINLVPYERE